MATGHHQNAILENLLALAGTAWAGGPRPPHLDRLKKLLTRKEYTVYW